MTKQFKIKKLPSIILKPINVAFDPKQTLSFKIDTDLDDIIGEIQDLLKNTVIDITEKTVA